MTRDEIVRLAREAGLSVHHVAEPPKPYDHIAGHGDKLQRFANLVIADFLERSAQYVTNDASRKSVISAARLEGWQVAREMAHTTCTEYAESRAQGDLERAIGADRCASAIRAMQPPAEWGGAEVARKSSATLTDKGDQLVLKSSPWPHPDGFAGGLTERRIDDGEGEESKKAT